MKNEDRLNELKKKISQLENEIEKVEKKDKDVKVKNVKKGFIAEKILYKWKSPSRVFKKRDKAWFLKIALVALIFILFFAFLMDLIVIVVICVMVLMAFLLGSIPPGVVEHEITNKGVRSMAP